MIECKKLLIEFKCAEANEIDKIIKNLDLKKGKNEELSTEIIIKIWNVNKEIITDMINNSIREGIV